MDAKLGPIGKFLALCSGIVALVVVGVAIWQGDIFGIFISSFLVLFGWCGIIRFLSFMGANSDNTLNMEAVDEYLEGQRAESGQRFEFIPELNHLVPSSNNYVPGSSRVIGQHDRELVTKNKTSAKSPSSDPQAQEDREWAEMARIL